MICDKFDNLRFYSCMLNNLEDGLQGREALRNPEAGRYEFDGSFLPGSKGETKPMSEGHLRLIENMQMFRLSWRAAEEIAWADPGDLKEDREYNGDNDKAATGAEDNVMRTYGGDVLYCLSLMGTSGAPIRPAAIPIQR